MMFFWGFADMDQVQTRSTFYQQRSATLNHNGSSQYPSNTTWHRQSSVDLGTPHQGSLKNLLDSVCVHVGNPLFSLYCRYFVELAPPLPSSAPPPTRIAQWNVPHDPG